MLTPQQIVLLGGLAAYGDVRPLTLYRNRRGRKVVFYQAPPKEPPSILQRIQRQLFQIVAADWQALSSSDRQKWETISLKTRVPMTGYNLFTMCELNGTKRQAAKRLATLAGFASLPPFTVRDN